MEQATTASAMRHVVVMIGDRVAHLPHGHAVEMSIGSETGVEIGMEVAGGADLDLRMALEVDTEALAQHEQMPMTTCLYHVEARETFPMFKSLQGTSRIGMVAS